jgi:hypothetical protein
MRALVKIAQAMEAMMKMICTAIVVMTADNFNSQLRHINIY